LSFWLREGWHGRSGGEKDDDDDDDGLLMHMFVGQCLDPPTWARAHAYVKKFPSTAARLLILLVIMRSSPHELKARNAVMPRSHAFSVKCLIE
jgi:hypothetical protein